MKDYGENVYNLIPIPKEQIGSREKYQSQFHENAVQELKDCKTSHKTMGKAKVDLRTTSEFLKANDHATKKQDATNHQHRINAQRKLPIPKKEEVPLMGIKTNKDFIKQNAIENIMSVPKVAPRNVVDRHLGDRMTLPESGLEKKYIKKMDYGEVPHYIVRGKEDFLKYRQEYEAYLEETRNRSAIQLLDGEEKQNIIDGLKQNWDELHASYQSMSVVIDTIPKRMHKEELESQMKALERDIETLESNKHIYVGH